MPYTSVDDLRLALNPGGGQDRSTASDLSDDELADAIGEAQARVDDRLRARYSVPFEDGEVPASVKLIVRDLAAYEATLRHRRSQPLDERHPVALRFAQATAMLDGLASGKAEAIALTSDDVVVQNQWEGDLFPLSDFDLGPQWPGYPWLG